MKYSLSMTAIGFLLVSPATLAYSSASCGNDSSNTSQSVYTYNCKQTTNPSFLGMSYWVRLQDPDATSPGVINYTCNWNTPIWGSSSKLSNTNCRLH